MRNCHHLSAEIVLEKLRTDPDRGLSRAEAAERLSLHGRNELSDRSGGGFAQILRRQIFNPLVVIIFFSAAISFFIGHHSDAFFILFVILLNIALGFLQEVKAEKALAALRADLRFGAAVLRDGGVRQIDSAEVVPGDILVLRPGDRVPADARLLEAENLLVSGL